MRTDILLNENFDLNYTANGEIVRGESTQQHKLLLTVCAKGEFKESPTVCIGAYGFLKDNDVTGFLGEVKKEYERDGMTVTTLQFTDGILKDDAYYP
jgi:hypothetical protein